MTGPEHYKAGEEAIAEAGKSSNTFTSQEFYVRLAQAHFTAAAAAATALDASRRDGFGWENCGRDIDSWHAAAGTG